MAVQLPKFGALKSKYNNKYLQYVHENSSHVRTFFQYRGENICSPFTKHEFEQAQCDSTLYHIKCCFNNKYWTSWASDHNFIVAMADQKDEDKSKWTCTLFRPQYDTSHQSFRFFHVFLGFHVVLWRVGPPYGDCLHAQLTEPDKDLCDLNIVFNMDSFVLLPRYLSFRGDNGLFCNIIMWQNLPHLEFASYDIEDPMIRMEAIMTNDGNVRKLSTQRGRFWRYDIISNYILVDSSDTTNQDIATLFCPTRVSSTVVALRNLVNGRYMKIRFTSRQSFIFCGLTVIDEHAHFTMVKLVRLREISNVVFYFFDATIYNESVVVLATASASNETTSFKSVSLNFTYSDITSGEWSFSMTTKFSNVTTKMTSGVPIIFDHKSIGTSTLFSGEYTLGNTVTTIVTNEFTHGVLFIPGMSTITATLYATKGSCRVPFSYKQCDKLIDGKSTEFLQNDGVYNGTNYYNINYDTKLTPISK